MTNAITITRRSALIGTGAVAVSGLAGGVGPNARGETRAPGATAMNILRKGASPTAIGSPKTFTGTVRVDMPFKGTGPARIRGATVAFEPGARTAWHTHPLGQTLIVTQGAGWVQSIGGPKEDIRAGDIVWIPAGEKHWHGATATTAMSHIAISEALDGKTVDWLELVSDVEFNG